MSEVVLYISVIDFCTFVFKKLSKIFDVWQRPPVNYTRLGAGRCIVRECDVYHSCKYEPYDPELPRF
jgi:hypothetical protein